MSRPDIIPAIPLGTIIDRLQVNLFASTIDIPKNMIS